MAETLQTKAEVETLISEKAKEAAVNYIKDNGSAVVNSVSGREAIKGMLNESFDQFKVKHADNEVTLAEYVNIMQKQFDEMAVAMKNEKGAKNKTFNEQLNDLLSEKAGDLTNLKSGEGKKVVMSLKAATTMLITSNYSGGTVGLTDWDPEFARIQRRQPFMRQLVNVRPVTGKYVAWAEQANPDGDAAWTAEGALKSQVDFDVVEATAEVKKLTAYIKVSREMLADLAFMNAEIRQELVERINLKFDTGILNGSGTGNEIKGILNYNIPTFAIPTGVAKIGTAAAPTANNFDVIRVAVTQVMLANFMPNFVIVNPVDAANMELAKGANGQYVMPPFSTANGQTVAGVQVVVNNGVAAGTFLVGDFSRDTLAMREELNISVGYENDDFTKNLVTVLAELRAVNYIKTNYLNAFVKGTFATAIGALTPLAA